MGADLPLGRELQDGWINTWDNNARDLEGEPQVEG